MLEFAELGKLADEHDREALDRVKKAATPVMSTLRRIDESVHQTGADEMVARLNEAHTALLTPTTDVGARFRGLIAGMPEEKRQLIEAVAGNVVTPKHVVSSQRLAEIESLERQVQQQSDPTVIDAPTPSEALKLAVEESVAAATKVVTLTSEVEALRAAADKATDDLEELFPESDDQVSPWGVGANTFKKLHALNLAVKEKEALLKTKVDELTAATADAQSKATAVQQELQNLAHQQRPQQQLAR